MENVGQIFKDGFKKISEAAMDAMVQSFITNQEQHFQQLQDMQKWGIVKIFQKFASSRFLHKTPCVASGKNLSLLDLSKKKSQNDHSINVEKTFLHSQSIGELEFTAHQAKFILLGNNITIQESLSNNYEWKIKFRYGNSSAETNSTQLSANTYEPSEPAILREDKNVTLFSSTLNSWRFTDLKKKSNIGPKTSSTPNHELHWNSTLVLKNIQDLWGDICIDLLWKKIEIFNNEPVPLSDDKRYSNKRSFSFSQNKQVSQDKYINSDSNSFSAATASTRAAQNESNSLNLYPNSDSPVVHTDVKTSSEGPPDLCPGRRKPPGSAWQLYGRCIIPLISIIYSFGMSKNKKKGSPFSKIKFFRDNISFALTKSCPAHFWLHLFPHNSNEIKFYRPVPGYSGLGMTNPKTTLGFLEITLKLKMHKPLPISSILSMLNPPLTYWRNSYFFEPQYLETYGSRCRHLLLTFPRWVPKFLHLSSHTGYSTRNIYDWFCIVVFWYMLINCCLFGSLWIAPALIALCITSVSLSYLFGYHFIQPAYTTTILCKDGLETTTKQKSVDSTPTSVHLDDVGKKTFTEATHQSFFSKKLRQPKTAFHKKTVKSQASPIFDPLITTPENCLETHSSPKSEKSLKFHDLARTAHPSVSTVESPFGPLHLNVNDPSSYFPKYPVFADDAGEHDIHELFDSGVTILDNVQRFTAIFSYVLEKLKFALNWEDPLLTFVSLVLLVLTLIAIYVYLFIISYLPLWVSRLPLMGPLILFMIFTDPWYQKNIWLKHFDLDLPFLYKAFILRSHYRKKIQDDTQTTTENAQKKKTLVLEEEGILEKQFAKKTKNSTDSSFYLESPKENDLLSSDQQQKLTTNDTVPQNQFTSFSDSKYTVSTESKKKLQTTVLSSTNMWQTMLDRWSNRQKQQSKKVISIYDKETQDIKSGIVVNDSRTIDVSNVLKKSETPSSKETPPYTALGQSYKNSSTQIKKGVLVKSIPKIKTNIKKTDSSSKRLPSLQVLELIALVGRHSPRKIESTSTNKKFMFCRVCNFFRVSLRFLWSKTFIYVKNFISFFIFQPCLSVFSYFGYSVLVFLDSCLQIIMYWWLHLPDRREIEHRQMAATQCINNLSDLIPNQQSNVDLQNFTLNYFNQNHNPKQHLTEKLIKLTPSTSIIKTKVNPFKNDTFENRPEEYNSGITKGTSLFLLKKTKELTRAPLAKKNYSERLTSSCSVPGNNEYLQQKDKEKLSDVIKTDHFSDSEDLNLFEPIK